MFFFCWVRYWRRCIRSNHSLKLYDQSDSDSSPSLYKEQGQDIMSHRSRKLDKITKSWMNTLLQ